MCPLYGVKRIPLNHQSSVHYRMARNFRGQNFSWISLDKNFRYLIFEDCHALLAPPTSNCKLTTPIAQLVSRARLSPNNRSVQPDCSSHTMLCCPPADFSLQFAWSCVVPFAHSECAPCFPTHSALSRWQIRLTTKVLISREDHEDRVACS